MKTEIPILRIKQWLSEKGISVSKCEEMAGISSGSLNKAIRRQGDINVNTLIKIAEAFKDFSLNYILFGDISPEDGNAKSGYGFEDNTKISYEKINDLVDSITSESNIERKLKLNSQIKSELLNIASFNSNLQNKMMQRMIEVNKYITAIKEDIK